MSIVKHITAVRIWVLYAFVFSFPFDKWEALRIGGLTANKFLGVIYVGLFLMVPLKAFSVNRHSKIALVLVALWIWLLFSSLINHVMRGSDFDFLFALLSGVLFFFLMVNEIGMNPRVRGGMLMSFVWAMFVVACLVKTGFGVQLNSDGDLADSLDGINRIWFFGLNPNTLGNYSAFSILMVIFLVFEHLKAGWAKALHLLMLPVFFSLLGFSGSSGAVIAMALGLMTYFVFRKENLIGRLKLSVIAIACLFGAVHFLSGFEYLVDKLNLFYSSRDTSGRTEIWAHAWEIASANPLIGLGKQGGEKALLASHGTYDTAHNVYLDMFVWGGLVGLLLYVGFFVLLTLRSIKNLNVTGHASSLTLTLVIAFLMLKSGGGATSKYVYLLLPYAAWVSASTPRLPKYNLFAGWRGKGKGELGGES